jgi:hypothetical protein
MDLGGWLRSLGLEKYEAVLRDSEIDEAILHDLTEDHLRELGFPLGARLKLLNAIATLGSLNPAAPTPVKLLPTPSAPLRGSDVTAWSQCHVCMRFASVRSRLEQRSPERRARGRRSMR